MQHLPTSKPKLKSPFLDKIDVESLKKDIPKYAEFLPKDAAASWQTWLENLETNILCIPEDPVWPLDVLKVAKQVRPEIISDTLPDTLVERQLIVSNNPFDRLVLFEFQLF